jgi:putative alpha-1,2-mannosidase
MSLIQPAMVRDNVDNVIGDAFLKGVPGIDWAAACAVQRFHAEQERCDSYREGDRGWVPEDRARDAGGRRVRSPSSHSLEFSLNDHAAAVIARGLGRTAEAERWARRSRGWEQLCQAGLEMDGERGFVVGRTADVRWTAGLFCEGLTWDCPFML